MKTDIWMPLYVKDYLASTSRLSTLEHGVYLLLLMDYWVNGVLPNDNDILLQITKQPKDNLRVISGLLNRYFRLNENNQWVNARAEIELLNAQDRRKIAQENGKKGGRPPKNKPKDNLRGNPDHNPEITSSPAPSSTHTQLQSKSEKRGAFAPPSFDQVKDYCLKRFNNVDAQKFIDFYQSKNWMIGKNKMSDWQAAVRTWENRKDEVKKVSDSSDAFQNELSRIRKEREASNV